jgi:hypothetical protein
MHSSAVGLAGVPLLKHAAMGVQYMCKPFHVAIFGYSYLTIIGKRAFGLMRLCAAYRK